MIKRIIWIFWNSEQRRLRAFWRFMFHALSLMVPLSLAVVVEVFKMIFKNPIVSEAFGALSALVTLVSMLGIIWLAGRFLDRRKFSDFGVRLNRNWWIDLCFGLALGAGLMVLIFLVELAAGWIAITGTFQSSSGLPFGLAILFPVIVFICVGIYEECMSRGYHLKNMAEGFGFIHRVGLGPKGAIIGATLLSSTIFGLLHGANPNATAISTFNIVLAGIFLALGYILTGDLAIPIGVHITWNFFQGNVFGFPVSGTDAGTTFITIEQGGDALVTGGAFGPEAGLIGIGAMVLGCALTVLWVRLRYGSAGIREKLATPELLPRKQDQVSTS